MFCIYYCNLVIYNFSIAFKLVLMDDFLMRFHALIKLAIKLSGCVVYQLTRSNGPSSEGGTADPVRRVTLPGLRCL
jgi:hypothetical protein